MQKEVLLEMFREANPMLCELSPTICVDEITESFSGDSAIIVHDPPLLQIEVKKPFVFDNQLVPTEFQGIEVKNITIGKFPSEFPEPLTDDFPLEEYHDPKRYVEFVRRRLPVIRKKLKNSDLSEEEALDALTGGWRKHVEWCKQLTKKRLAETD